MSADDGIYILQTLGKGDATCEYRVKHLQSIENYLWDDKGPSADPDVHIANARRMWADCTPCFNGIAANELANTMHDKAAEKFGALPEYGIQVIFIQRVF